MDPQQHSAERLFPPSPSVDVVVGPQPTLQQTINTVHSPLAYTALYRLTLNTEEGSLE